MNFLFFNWSIFDLQYYMSFMCTAKQFFYIINNHLKKSSDYSSPIKLLQYYWLYPLCYILHAHNLFYSWKFLLLNLLSLFCPTPTPFPSNNHRYVFSICGFLSILLLIYLFYFLDSTYRWNQTVFVFLFLFCFT